MNIGTAAAISGVPTKSIRYYESIGLIPSARRASNGYRIYDETDVRTLRFIHCAHGVGFTIEGVAALLALWRDHARPNAEVKRLALRRLAEIERKLQEVEDLKHVFVELAAHGRGDPRPACPIVDPPVPNRGRRTHAPRRASPHPSVARQVDPSRRT
ncbi:MAG: MerR family transcriptional regulator [Sphingomonadaceae bacterium]